MTEADKILPFVQDKLAGKRVLDLGCGEKKIVPWAVGVDDCSESTIAKPDVNAKVGVTDSVALLAKLKGLGLPGRGEWPVVFSSHTLEHLREPILENLWWWFSLAKVGGLLVLYLPDESRYVYDPKNLKGRNPWHKHYLTQNTSRWALEQVTGAEILVERPYDYSSLFIVERTV